jgi:hypothetical protein
MTLPSYWRAFLAAENLVGTHTTIPEEEDRSSVGAEICWFDDEGARSEKEELYPGIAVAKDGFIPVGGCDIGTGDPYFICVMDGVGGPLYRIYHDRVSEAGYTREEAVAVVLTDYREVSRFK